MAVAAPIAVVTHIKRLLFAGFASRTDREGMYYAHVVEGLAVTSDIHC
jgi:hypothetical protein